MEKLFTIAELWSSSTFVAETGAFNWQFLVVGVPAIILLILIFVKTSRGNSNFVKAEQEAAKLADAATREAESIMKEAQAVMKEARITVKEQQQKAEKEFQHSSKQSRKELEKIEKRVSEREVNLERKVDLVENRSAELGKREDNLRAQQEKLDGRNKELDGLISQTTEKLQGIAGMSRDQAREHLLQQLDKELDSEKGSVIRRHAEEIRKTSDREAQGILVNAIQRYAADCTSQRTSAIIALPNDEMKGRIIGREGRNIRVIEAATGVNVLVDDTPDAVVISCFDPIRKEIARVTMERLIEDGRIHPTRIEETIAKVKQDIDEEVFKAGQEAVDNLGLGGVNNNLVSLLGRLKFRYSYSQNVLKHSVEVARMMAMIAEETGLDVEKAKWMGLFHDIGKAVDHEVEGSHAVIGGDILKRAGIDEEIINGVASHHEDVPANSPLAILVSACDTISAGRPGARSETSEIYLKRLHQLEDIGKSFKGVNECFAIQGGRELRIIVDAGEVKENAAYTMARDIAKRIEKEMKYPGQIKVAILRETRSIEYAK